MCVQWLRRTWPSSNVALGRGLTRRARTKRLIRFGFGVFENFGRAARARAGRQRTRVQSRDESSSRTEERGRENWWEKDKPQRFGRGNERVDEGCLGGWLGFLPSSSRRQNPPLRSQACAFYHTRETEYYPPPFDSQPIAKVLAPPLGKTTLQSETDCPPADRHFPTPPRLRPPTPFATTCLGGARCR